MEDIPSFAQAKPYQRLHLESSGDFVNVRVNETERQQLDRFKTMLNIDQDSRALKVGLTVALNVLQSNFSYDLLRFLTQRDRTRPIQ